MAKGNWYLERLQGQKNKYRLYRVRGQRYYFDTLKEFETLINVVAKGANIIIRRGKGMPKGAERIAYKHYLNNRKIKKSKNRKK